MDFYTTYTVNIAMEVSMLVIMGFLLVSCNMQKNRFATTRPLMALAAANMLLLACQLVEWQVMRMECLGAAFDIMAAKRLTYALDYALYYAVSFCFFNYITVYISELCAEQGIVYQKPVQLMTILISWGVIISVVYMVLISNDMFYYLDANGNEMFRPGFYLVMYLLSTVSMVASCVTLIRNHRLLKTKGFWLLLLYVVLPFIFIFVDLIHRLCISYMLMAFFVFILYIEINLRRGALMLEQSAKLALQEKGLTELKTRIMLSQMQPHFLYNTLSTISTLCYVENALQAKDVADKFSDYLRQNLDSMGKDEFIPFEKELEHISTYLWIEQVRFGDVLKVEQRIGPKNFALPSLTLQPLVENAVKHGIRGKKGGGTVTIETRETPEEYLVTIADDGAGFDLNQKKEDGRSHVGIANIRERLELLGAGYLEIHSKAGQGTTGTVHLRKECAGV